MFIVSSYAISNEMMIWISNLFVWDRQLMVVRQFRSAQEDEAKKSLRRHLYEHNLMDASGIYTAGCRRLWISFSWRIVVGGKCWTGVYNTDYPQLLQEEV